MKPSLILKEMNELRETWRKQGFNYTAEQKLAYNKLLELRRKRVKSFFKNNRVWKGGSSTTAKTTSQDK